MPVPDSLSWKPTGEKLGSGGQGTVWIVFQENDPSQTLRALKELNRPDSEHAQERFQREIETVKRLSHHTIIKVLDHSDIDDEFQFYVMEYHQNAKTLEEIIFPPACNPFHGNILKCLDLFEQIITAIQVCEVQSDSILHRDISPKNILVLENGNVCLIDFGLCHTVNDTTITLTGENLGTRSYAAPECGAGSEFEIGTFSDIYSAAKVLWSTITSERAFDREAPIMNRKSMENMIPHNEEIWHLNRIFNNTIQYDPKDRFHSTGLVLSHIVDIRHAIDVGFPPLETVASRCPSCGRKSVRGARERRQVFGGYMNQDLTAHECSVCGFVFVRRHETLDRILKSPR